MLMEKSGYWTVWEDYVDFVCCDIGPRITEKKARVLIELGVWDNANMSFNAKGEPIYGDKVKPTIWRLLLPLQAGRQLQHLLAGSTGGRQDQAYSV